MRAIDWNWSKQKLLLVLSFLLFDLHKWRAAKLIAVITVMNCFTTVCVMLEEEFYNTDHCF